jgi:hypothetical protein
MRTLSARSWLIFGVVLLLQTTQPSPEARTVIPFDAGWRFSRTDAGNNPMPALNDAAWRVVDLPHDWSAEGPFAATNGSGNGYAPAGIGWYRKHFMLDAARGQARDDRVRRRVRADSPDEPPPPRNITSDLRHRTPITGRVRRRRGANWSPST